MFELILMAATFADVPVGMAFVEKKVAPVGDWCEECTPGGKPLFPSKPGHVGDGRIFSICGACDGTQKRKKEQTKVVQEPACADGSCGTTRQTYVRRGLFGRRR